MPTSQTNLLITINPRLFQCPICQHSFTRSHGLKRHLESVHERREQYECEICQRSFTLAQTRDDHLVSHTQLTPYDCSICDAKFKSRRTRSRHMAQYHANMNQDTCMRVSSSSIDSISNVAPSIASSSSQPTSTSSLTGRKRSRSPSLLRDNSNSTNELFLCGLCTQAYQSQDDLNLHLETRHNMIINQNSKITDFDENHESDGNEECKSSIHDTDTFHHRKKRARPSTIFSCPYAECGHTFHYRHVLTNHIRARHTFETPFSCAVCERTFPTLARKVAHEKTHLTLFHPPKGKLKATKAESLSSNAVNE